MKIRFLGDLVCELCLELFWGYSSFFVVLSLESCGPIRGVIIYENRTTTSQVWVQLSIVSGVD